jgi:hypothetical protein
MGDLEPKYVSYYNAKKCTNCTRVWAIHELDERGQCLVCQLRDRIEELETDNDELQQQIDSLQAKVHLCGNPSCCNPFHLEAVTQRVNNLRSRKNGKLRCKHGHDLMDPSNIYWERTGRYPRKICRTCRRRWHQTYQQRKKERLSACQE